jgi:glycosyltransferase involved in cell wall biosynthesis
MKYRTMLENKQPAVSIVIKAYNEQRHIGAAIESALAALRGIDGEVILADGASTDRTIEIAQAYPIKIVRLDNPADRSCGAGGQLGYQYSRGRFVCLMDGDMRLHPDFLVAALRFLEAHPEVAGVGGGVVDRQALNLEYMQRSQRHDPDRQAGEVTRLNASGIYRRAAIESIGYATDRNLHGGEELDLAARLQARGWRLARIDCPAIDHYVHTGSAFRLLMRRIRSRNSFGPGEMARAALGQAQLGFILRHDRTIVLSVLVALWWFTIAAVLLLVRGSAALFAAATIAIMPFAVMSLRYRSLPGGIYAVAVWNVFTLCFMPGFLRPRAAPAEWMASSVIQDQTITTDMRRVMQR